MAKAGLPGPEQKVLDFMALNAEPPSSDEERIDRAVEQWRALAGTMAPFDEDEVREREAAHPRPGEEHRCREQPPARGGVVTGSDRRSRRGSPRPPLSSTAGGPDLRYAHGEATAKAIPGATLLAIEGMGHELPPPAISILVGAILDHTA